MGVPPHLLVPDNARDDSLSALAATFRARALFSDMRRPLYESVDVYRLVLAEPSLPRLRHLRWFGCVWQCHIRLREDGVHCLELDDEAPVCMNGTAFQINTIDLYKKDKMLLDKLKKNE